MNFLDVGGECYAFKTLEQLIEMLKDDGYDVNLNIRKVGKMIATKVAL